MIRPFDGPLYSLALGHNRSSMTRRLACPPLAEFSREASDLGSGACEGAKARRSRAWVGEFAWVDAAPSELVTGFDWLSPSGVWWRHRKNCHCRSCSATSVLRV